MLQNLLIIIFGIYPISADYPHLYDFWICFMLTFCIYNCIFCIRMIMIGIKFKLQEQLQCKTFIKMYQIDVSASICSNFNSYLTVVLSI